MWAQNDTHAFVTLRLDVAQRRVEPDVAYGVRDVSVHVPAPSAGEAAAVLALETYRELRPVQCGWQITNRGLLLRLHKRTAGHWPRLLQLCLC